MTRGFGFKPGIELPTDFLVGALIGAPIAALPVAVDNSKLVLDIFDQSITQSCVGQSTASQIWCALVKRGVVAPKRPSTAFPYYNARAFSGDQHTDAGTYIRDAYRAFNRFGYCPEEDWPFDPGTINLQPAWKAYAGAADQRLGLKYYFIRSTGEQLKQEIKQALVKGYTIVFGTLVATSFADHDGNGLVKPPEPNDTVAGGHAMHIVGYTEHGCKIVNSWGKDWGAKGFAHLSWEYILWSGTRDFSVLEVAPNYSDEELIKKVAA